MSGDRPALSESIDADAVEVVVRECLVVLGIAFITGLALLAPGADRQFPRAAVAVADVIVAIGTVAVVGSMMHAAPRVRDLVASAVDGPDSVVADVSAIAGYLVAFVAVLVAYRGLAPLAIPLVDGLAWAYDQAFLLFAGVVLALIARRLYRSLDPIAGLLTRELLDATGREASAPDA